MGEAQDERAGKLPVLGLLRDVFGIYGQHWKVLIPMALVVLIPQGAANLLELELDLDFDGDPLDFERGVLLALTGAAIVATNLAGEALYAALITALVVSWSHGVERPPIRATLRQLPLLRLIVADILIVLGIVLGFLLLVIPGLIFLVYSISTTVVIELEDASIRRGLERSLELVRGSFARVLLIMALVSIVSDSFTAALTELAHHTVLEAAIHVAAETLLEPIQGLAIVLLTLGLMRLRGERPPVPQ